MKKIFISLALCSAIGFTAFAAGDTHTHWGYTGHGGPEKWGELSKDFATCKAGKNQSPINITSSIEAKLEPLAFNYNAKAKEILNNGHTIQVNMEAGSFVTLEGKEYELKQFHFHTPSENQINGKSFALEAHFVHADKNKNLTVIGVMFEEGEENKALAKIWSAMPKKPNEKKASNVSAEETTALMPKEKSYYRFNGSLTTPPCTEGVRWVVLKEPLMISKAQVEEFLNVMHHANNRPIQPINARPLLKAN
ncbi:MAG TPA: carbonic anhydrase family protein [Campylobacterales bacterium]|nr:carbonic anhydrase family protein [Campylobacterales bacterium]